MLPLPEVGRDVCALSPSWMTLPFGEHHFSWAYNVRYYLKALDSHFGSISVTLTHAKHHDSFYRFKVIAWRVQTWYERAKSFEPAIFSALKPSNLREPLQLARKPKIEEPLLHFDMGNMEFLFVERSNLWECALTSGPQHPRGIQITTSGEFDFTSWSRFWEVFGLRHLLLVSLRGSQSWLCKLMYFGDEGRKSLDRQ